MTLDDDHNTLARAVQRMRYRQKEHFNTPTIEKLIAAKAAEHLVDEALAELNSIRKLWPDEPTDVQIHPQP